MTVRWPLPPRLKSRSLRRERLRHRVATDAVFANRGAIDHVAVSEVEPSCRLGAVQGAANATSFERASLEHAEQCPADATKSGVRRNVVQSDESSISHRAHREDRVILDRDENRVVW